MLRGKFISPQPTNQPTNQPVLNAATSYGSPTLRWPFTARTTAAKSILRPNCLGRMHSHFFMGKHDNPLQFRWIGLREHLQENPIFNWKFDGFRLSFSLKPLHQSFWIGCVPYFQTKPYHITSSSLLHTQPYLGRRSFPMKCDMVLSPPGNACTS